MIANSSVDVIFRKQKNGNVVALFPGLPADTGKKFATSYMHIGQHSAVDYKYAIESTVTASKKEYADLLAELEDMGYKLNVVL